MTRIGYRELGGGRVAGGQRGEFNFIFPAHARERSIIRNFMVCDNLRGVVTVERPIAISVLKVKTHLGDFGASNDGWNQS